MLIKAGETFLAEHNDEDLVKKAKEAKQISPLGAALFIK